MDEEGRRLREDEAVPAKDWKPWRRTMVPDRPEYAGRTRWYTRRNSGHEGFYCENVSKVYKHIGDCGIYEIKAVSEKVKTRRGRKFRFESKHYVVYVGKTNRETSNTDLHDRLIKEYCAHGSQKAININRVLKDGYEIYTRVKPLSEEQVENEENKMLSAYNYAWNYLNNLCERDDVPPKVK